MTSRLDDLAAVNLWFTRKQHGVALEAVSGVGDYIQQTKPLSWLSIRPEAVRGHEMKGV